MLERDVTYLVGYPNWLPFVERTPGVFEEVYRETLSELDICGGLDMIVYRVHRDRLLKIVQEVGRVGNLPEVG